MKISLEMIEDVEEARSIHTLAFPDDLWAGDDHTYWKATDEDGKVVGFCSAIYWRERRAVFLSRAAAATRAQGQGLQRRMIKARVRWAMKEGAHRVVTYTALKNYESIVNLLKCGFRFYHPVKPWAGTNVHYFVLRM